MLYKELITAIRTTLESDPIINGVYESKYVEFDLHNKKFPFGLTELVGVVYAKTYTTYNFKIYFMDQKQKSEFNELDIFSQMERSARFFIATISTNVGGGFQIDLDNTTAEMNYWSLDEGVAGVILSFGLITPTAATDPNCI